jgi:hypothetical protein
VVDRLQVVAERLSSNGDALFDDRCRLDSGQRVPLDRVRCVGEFDVLRMIKIRRPAGRADAELVEFSLPGDNGGDDDFPPPSWIRNMCQERSMTSMT